MLSRFKAENVNNTGCRTQNKVQEWPGHHRIHVWQNIEPGMHRKLVEYSVSIMGLINVTVMQYNGFNGSKIQTRESLMI